MSALFSPNLMNWRRQDVVALALAVTLGCVCGVVLGYVIIDDNRYIGWWTRHYSPAPFAVYLFGKLSACYAPYVGQTCWDYDWRSLEWGLFGGGVGGMLVYIRQLLVSSK
jgi:hypothetical protein